MTDQRILALSAERINYYNAKIEGIPCQKDSAGDYTKYENAKRVQQAVVSKFGIKRVVWALCCICKDYKPYSIWKDTFPPLNDTNIALALGASAEQIARANVLCFSNE